MENFDQTNLSYRLIGVAIIIAVGFLIYLTDRAEWAIRLSLCTVFCAIIYVREHSVRGRWIAIGIIVAGTLASLIWEISRTVVDSGLFENM